MIMCKKRIDVLNSEHPQGKDLEQYHSLSEYFFPVNAWNFGFSSTRGGSRLLLFGGTWSAKAKSIDEFKDQLISS